MVRILTSRIYILRHEGTHSFLVDQNPPTAYHSFVRCKELMQLENGKIDAIDALFISLVLFCDLVLRLYVFQTLLSADVVYSSFV